MTRYGAMYGPDLTFLGVDACDLGDPASFADADVVILGAPFDGGTSHRPGTRFGPSAIRQACYLPHDGSRPSLAMRTDGLRDLRVYDAGDVECFSGDIVRSVAVIEQAVATIAAAGAIPVVLGGDHTIALPDVTGVARHLGFGRVSVLHFDAHADTGNSEFGSLLGHGQPMRRLIESGAARGDRFLQIGLRGYWPGPETLDWMAEQNMRSYEMTEIVARGLEECLTEAFGIATDDCDGVFLSVDIDVVDPGQYPRSPICRNRSPRAAPDSINGRNVLAVPILRAELGVAGVGVRVEVRRRHATEAEVPGDAGDVGQRDRVVAAGPRRTGMAPAVVDRGDRLLDDSHRARDVAGGALDVAGIVLPQVRGAFRCAWPATDARFCAGDGAPAGVAKRPKRVPGRCQVPPSKGAPRITTSASRNAAGTARSQPSTPRKV